MVASGNVGLAFGLVTAAGACTAVGAAIVFCVHLAQPKFLAGSLGFSAGVML
jgi:ZIP family zinc transporter